MLGFRVLGFRVFRVKTVWGLGAWCVFGLEAFGFGVYRV